MKKGKINGSIVLTSQSITVEDTCWKITKCIGFVKNFDIIKQSHCVIVSIHNVLKNILKLEISFQRFGWENSFENGLEEIYFIFMKNCNEKL